MPHDSVVCSAKAAQRNKRYLTQCGVSVRNIALACVLYLAGAGIGSGARTDVDIARMCDLAAIKASDASGVPLDILRALSRTETGRAVDTGLQPWPWTVNMEGKGRWFATLDDARAYVFSHFKEGARSFDVGCYQINYKWHGDAFRSIDDMFDPFLNAQYAAQFVSDLYQEFGNWPDAAGAYHSRTPEFARKYAARFDRVRAELSDQPVDALTYESGGGRWRNTNARDLSLSQKPRPLFAGGTLALGSLVPILRQSDSRLRPIVIFN